MYTLGLNAAFQDPSACLVRDGVVLAAAEEERFTRVPHGKRPLPFTAWELPFHAIDFCLASAGIALRDVESVAYSFDPYALLGNRPLPQTGVIQLPVKPGAAAGPTTSPWDPLFLCYVLNAPEQLVNGAPLNLKKRFAGARAGETFEWTYVPHHLAHAASAYHASPFDGAAVLTLDGRGERATTSYGIGEGARLTELNRVELPHSLGLLYEEVTSYLGFLRCADEHKVLALASFGKPRFVEAFRQIVDVGGDGTYQVAPPYLETRFGPPRAEGGPLEPRHLDVARSLQQSLEESVLELARWLRAASGEKRLCLAGGVALNCALNAKLRDSGLFEDVWVQPAAGDAGTALGAALWVDARERQFTTRGPAMDHAFLGPSYSDAEIRELLDRSRLSYEEAPDTAEAAAELLAQDKIIGWFQGRMEFGPRALGSRSILASPLSPDMQERLNEIKEREDFRPVAPVVLEEKAAEWFTGARPSPFMLFVYDARPEKAAKIPAVRHVDGTARIQTIARGQNALFYDLLKAFERRTGVPVLLNASFRTGGEPIVCTPRDAVECFWTSPLDALVIGSFVLRKATA